MNSEKQKGTKSFVGVSLTKKERKREREREREREKKKEKERKRGREGVVELLISITHNNVQITQLENP